MYRFAVTNRHIFFFLFGYCWWYFFFFLTSCSRNDSEGMCFFCVQKVNHAAVVCLQAGNSHEVPLAPLENESWILKKEFSLEGLSLSPLYHLSSPDSGSGLLANWASHIGRWLCRLHNQTVVLVWGKWKQQIPAAEIVSHGELRLQRDGILRGNR